MRDDSDDWIITKGPNGTRISVRRSELTRNPDVELREKIAKARKTVPKPVVDPFKDKPKKVKEIHAAQVSYDEERSRRVAYSQAASEERKNASCMQELAIAVLIVTVVLMILMSR